jgi:endonuclease YncB( thermonuclease family)
MTDWIYPNCKITRVIDADTFDVFIDHGRKIYSETRIRLAGVDAAESYGRRRSKLGAEAKKYCVELLEGKSFTVISKEMTGKYGRLIADIKLPENLLSDHLVKIGYAKKVKY